MIIIGMNYYKQCYVNNPYYLTSHGSSFLKAGVENMLEVNSQKHYYK